MWCTGARRILFSPHKFGGKTMQWREKYRVTHGSRTVFKKKVLGRFST